MSDALMLNMIGVDEAADFLKKQGRGMGEQFAIGLKRAGLYLQRKSQELCPVDIGNLVNSAFTRATGKGFKTEVMVGYTALYAVYVHEDLEARHEPGKQAKFLEQPAREERPTILEIVMAGGKSEESGEVS